MRLLVLCLAFACTAALADQESGTPYCTTESLPSAGKDNNTAKLISLSVMGLPLQTNPLNVCAGSWLHLSAGGGSDCDVATVTDSLCNNGSGCFSPSKCASDFNNGDNDYSWTITGADAQEGPFGNLKQNVFIRLPKNWGQVVTVQVNRAECAKKADAQPVQPVTFVINTSMPSFERYNAIATHDSATGMTRAQADTDMLTKTKDLLLKDDIGVDICQPNKTSPPHCAGLSNRGPEFGVACCTGLRMAPSGSVTEFTFPNSGGHTFEDINTSAELSACFSIAAQMKFVQSISYCGGLVNAAACAQVGRDNIIFEDGQFAYALIHEYGHTAGLQHPVSTATADDDHASNVMQAPTLGGIVTSSQCSSYQNKSNGPDYP